MIVNYFGNPDAFKKNVDEEYKQNQERYKFLKWAQKSFDNFRVVPPGTGICHQVNLEYLSQTVWTAKDKVKSRRQGQVMDVAYPDTLVGTDSHTTMVNGLAVLGWGVGGIEAEAAMLGQPLFDAAAGSDRLQAHRQAEGRRHRDRPRADRDADAAQARRGRQVRRVLRPRLAELSIADRATLGNMAPEYGATCGFFPIDDETIEYLRDTGRSADRVALVAAYAKAQGMYRTKTTPDPIFTDMLKLDLVAGRAVARRPEASAGPRRAEGREGRLHHGDGQGIQERLRRRRQGRIRTASLDRDGALDKNFAKAGRAGDGMPSRPQARSRPRRRGDRRDHVVHQHVESRA